MKKRKINWFWMAFPIVGSIIGGIGVAVYFLVEKIILNDSSSPLYKRSAGKYSWFDFNGKEVEKGKNNDKVFEFKVVENKGQYINDEILKLVAHKFITRGIFGPELGSLKTISFNDPNLISSNKVNGAYITQSKEIGINTNNIETLINDYYKNKYGNLLPFFQPNENDLNEIKSEAIFQVLFHEYGHHIFASYAKNPYGGALVKIYDRNKFDKKNNVAEDNWNKKFLDKFMNIFSYDNNKLKPIDAGSYLWKVNSLLFNTIGQKFSAYSLFKKINLTKTKPSKEEWQKIYINYSQEQLLKKLNSEFEAPTRSMEDYSYYYSAEELFTRKLLLSSAKYSQEADQASNKQEIWPYDLIADFKNTNTPIYNYINLQKVNKTPNSTLFMNDYVFRNSPSNIKNSKLGWERSERYLKAVDELMGHKYNNNISFLWYKNNAYAVSDEKIIDYNQKTKERSKTNEIKFGGYVNNNNYKYIGYFENNKYNCISSIKTFPFQIGYKKSLFANKWEKIKYYKKDPKSQSMVIDNDLGKMKYTYYLNSWINPKTIENKKLYFSETPNGKSKTLLRKTRTKEQGFATTYSNLYSINFKRNEETVWSARSLKDYTNINGTKTIKAFDNNTGDYLAIYNQGKFKDAVNLI